MQKKFQRKLVDCEKSLLRKRLKFASKEFEGYRYCIKNWAKRGFYISLVICALGYLADEKPAPLWFFGVVIAITILGLSAFGYLEKRMYLPPIIRSMNELNSALADGFASVWNIQALKSAEIRRREKEEEYYLLQVEDDKSILIGGQAYFEVRKFPSTDFDLIDICTKQGKVLDFRIEKRGKELKPETIIDSYNPIEALIDYDTVEYPCSLENFGGYLRERHIQAR